MSNILQPGASIKPKVDFTDIETILRQVYGLKCFNIKELNGYDDRNFHIKAQKSNDGCTNPYLERVSDDGYTLKIVNSMDSKNPILFDAQTKILLYLGKNDVFCPRPVKTISGEYFATKPFKSGVHIVRLLEFISGSILYQIPASNSLFYQAGRFVANLDEILRNFHHPVYDDDNLKLMWSLDSVPQLLKFHFALDDDLRKKIVEDVVQEFENRVLSISTRLDRGQIHGDFNEQNILVTQSEKSGEWIIKGVLDFGDSHSNCYLYELAITMTYMIIQGKNLNVGGYVLKGYNSVREIPAEEFDLLRVCIAGRLCQSLVMGAYSILQDPGNDYLLTTGKAGWILLEELWTSKESELLTSWRKTMEKDI